MCPYEKHNGKLYYEIHKDILRKYSGTGTRVIVTMGPPLTPRDRSHALRTGPGE